MEARRGEELRDDSFLLLFNAHYEDISFRLPARRFGTHWEIELVTGHFEAAGRLAPGEDVTVEQRSIVVLRRV
jgi:glycogen operon protein